MGLVETDRMFFDSSRLGSAVTCASSTMSNLCSMRFPNVLMWIAGLRPMLHTLPIKLSSDKAAVTRGFRVLPEISLQHTSHTKLCNVLLVGS